MSDSRADLEAQAQHHGLGLRGADERRHDERRRSGRARRRRDRRRRGMRTLLLTAAALSAPHASRVITSSFANARGRLPVVSIHINSYVAPVDARHAYDDIIAEAAERYSLDPMMIKAVMQAESAFNAMAVSPVGALGLMQLMPDVAAELGADDPMDPRQNIMAGSRYLRQLLTAHGGNVRLALASYNAGPGTVAKYRAIPPFKETQDYVKKITGLLADAHASEQ